MHKALPLFLAAASFATLGCGKDERPVQTASAAALNTSASDSAANARGHSQVRVVNAVNGGGNVAVHIGEAIAFADVKAGTVTAYRETETNLARFTVHSVGATDGLMVSERDRMLMDGSRYTVFLISEDVSRNTLRVVKDDLFGDSAKARVRIIHAAPGGPEFDVAMLGVEDKLFNGVNFTSEGGYADVVPTTTTLNVTATREKKVLLSIPRLELRRGTATTIVITGTTKLRYFVFVDEPMPVRPSA